MDYIPLTEREEREILSSLGLKSPDELFRSIPSSCRHEGKLKIDPPHSEQELVARITTLGSRNQVLNHGSGWDSFLGAGAYQHFVPAAVDAIASRQEFASAYTPYQPEMCQGHLQAGFEFQSMIANLVGLNVANASMYDGASAMAEAILMAKRLSRKGEAVLLPTSIHPEYREVIKTYSKNLFEVKELEVDDSGRVDLSKINDADDCFAIVVQTPNFFGLVEQLSDYQSFASNHELKLVVGNTEPLALSILNSPGDSGADIFAGEGQSFGNRLQFGGPHLGILATRQQYVRQMPGRLVGRANDSNGQMGYVLTLSTRETTH